MQVHGPIFTLSHISMNQKYWLQIRILMEIEISLNKAAFTDCAMRHDENKTQNHDWKSQFLKSSKKEKILDF